MSDWPRGDGEMAARVRARDWAATPLGPIAAWSERLKVMVEQVLANPRVASLACRPDCILIYNEIAAKLYGDRHPTALGRPLPETFPEGWATVAPFYAWIGADGGPIRSGYLMSWFSSLFEREGGSRLNADRRRTSTHLQLEYPHDLSDLGISERLGPLRRQSARICSHLYRTCGAERLPCCG